MKDELEVLYLKLPETLQNAACSLVGWQNIRRRQGRGFDDFRRALEARAEWSEEEVRRYRDARLQRFLEHCAATVPYYRRLFAQLGISPTDVKGLNDLAALPPLTKGALQERGEELLSSAVPTRRRVVVHTSGTTGGGLRLATTRAAIKEQWTTWWRYRGWHGIRPGTWCGLFAGRSIVPADQARPPFWRYNWPGRQVLFSAYHMSESNLPYYLAELRRKKPPWLHGYPSLLTLIAEHCLASGGDLGYAPRWVTTGAENLLIQQVNVIEAAFGIRPRQHYGMTEAVANISECDEGRLHVDEDFAAVEFVKAGDVCRIIGTNLSNPATPLLRYDIQDLATLSAASCSCGRPGRIVESVDGRLDDYVILRNGARLGRMGHAFKDMIRIREAQIYQRRVGEIVLRVVRGRDYGPSDEDDLLAALRRRIGGEADVSIEYQEALPRTNSGKLRFVVSEVPEGDLESVALRNR